MSKYDLKLEGNAFQNFMLQHAEKVVLAAGVLLAATFIWFGWITPVFNKTMPDKLMNEARVVEQHIQSPTSWDLIKEYRSGIKDADRRIVELQGSVATTDYVLGYTRGTPARPAGLRLDPVLVAAEDLQVRTFRAPLIVEFPNPEIKKLRVASFKEETTTTGFQVGGDRNPTRERQRDRDPKIDAGETMPAVQMREVPGVRPKTAALDSRYNPYVKDFIVVTGLVPIQKQYQYYRDALAAAQGYYPPEDRPIYSKIEIQRRVEGGEWETLDEKQMKPDILPNAEAPEVIEPAYYDSVLTGRIPLVALADYRPWMIHPKVPLRKNVPRNVRKDLSGETDDRKVVIDPFGRQTGVTKDKPAQQGKTAEESHEDLELLKGNNPAAYEKASQAIRPKAEYKMIRFVDVNPPVGKPVQYRVRLWLNDPNQRDNPMLASSGNTAERQRDGSQFRVGGSGTGSASAGMTDEDLTRGQSGTSGTSNDPEEEEAKRYERITVTPMMLHPEVRRRLVEEMNRKDVPPGLRATDWSEPSPWIVAGSGSSEFFAGDAILEGMRTLRLGDVVIALSEPITRLVAGVWSEKYNTFVPSKREVARGDLLNFVAERVHMVNPRDYNVLRADNEKIETNGVVVDIMGGMELPLRNSPIRFQAPTDVLVLDAAGNLRVQNSLRDYKQYRHALFLDDEKAEYGKPRPTRDPTGQENR